MSNLSPPAPSLAELQAAADTVHAVLPPTPQHRWPLLEQALPAGTALWVKHENHTPLGAFKVRGGLVYLQRQRARWAAAGQAPQGLVSATRGNHGQSLAFAARRHGLPVTIFVPEGNSREKNAAMRALGAELVEAGADFQAAAEAAQAFANRTGAHMVPSFHGDLVAGVASYALELFTAQPGLQRVYVPIGMGSGAAGVVAARDALGLRTEIIGVTSTGAPAFARAFETGQPLPAEVTTVLADGMACRTPHPEALARLRAGLSRVVSVSDEAIAQAIRWLWESTHNVAEGAGAAALAAVRQEAAQLGGLQVAAILSGGNIDRPLLARVLSHDLPG